MEGYLLDWGNLILRWTHVIVAIAWIGSSFYFVFLDSNLTPPVGDYEKSQGVNGELWALHGGGFYHPVKWNVAPPKLPDHLHWFYWESYTTWLSGFALFTISYLWNANMFLVDPSVMKLTPAEAIAAALAFLVLFWILYDAVCRIFGQGKNGDASVGLLVLILVCIAAWLACHMFSGRAAYLLMGAMIATTMSANVFFWIMPGQRKVVAAIKAGQPVDPIHGKRGKQRSVHNTYFTLPVVFAMLSNHYAFLYSNPHNWVILILMMFAGAMVRQFFVMRHGYKLGRNGNPLPYALVGIVVTLGVIGWIRPAESSVAAGGNTKVSFEQVQKIVSERCFMCHGTQVQMKGINFTVPGAIEKHAQDINQQVVVTKIMPLNNATHITDDERAMIGKWFNEGAPAN
ncbi:MAG: urate hydroxylase PuuD [Burkholderiaceae bacterium]|jgi:uncharacterized membrane protein|nr:MAG: urate hydroxylase PuuD [Burkholderiaceae bacterium]